MRISDWSSDVCSSDLKSVIVHLVAKLLAVVVAASDRHARKIGMRRGKHPEVQQPSLLDETPHGDRRDKLVIDQTKPLAPRRRSEEHQAALQEQMHSTYADFC